jgi:hypothetical protein
MTNEEEVNMVEEEFSSNDTSDELSMDDLSSDYINHPSMGETIEFTSAKVLKITGKQLIVKKKDGDTFEKNLSKVDYGIEIHTDTGAIYTVAAWETWGKIKAIFNKLGTMKGVSFRVKHTKDGRVEKKGVDCYIVEALVDGTYKTLHRETKEWS